MDYYVRVYAESSKKVEGAIVVNKGTDNEIILVPMNKEDTYPCVLGSRADFEERGFDTSELSDREMERIFDKIGEVLVGEGGYWESIDCWGEDMPRKPGYDEE